MPTIYNKVVIDGDTLMDISDTTATATDVGLGKEFYTAAGTKAQGTAVIGNAISMVDTVDTNGGTIRTITSVDISDTTAVAADVAQGKYFYTAQGIKTSGTASGGSSSEGQTVTGTVTGSGTTLLQIPCSFEPDFIHLYCDLSGDVSLRGVTTLTIIKDVVIYQTQDGSSGSANESTLVLRGITGYNESDTINTHASYSNGVLTIDTVANSAAYRFTEGITYNYELSTIGTSGSSTPSATTHTIYFEFSDNTNITLTYYDDESTFISSAIRETTPTTYGGKTVTLAQLDGTTWYELSQETWETLYNGTSQVNPDTPYNLFWVSSMSEVYPIVGSVWRITIDNIEYRCVAVSTTMSGGTYVTIGNPKYSGGTDDGTETPFSFYNAGWGAWVGDTELTSGVYYNLKIERLVTT